jgi:hypothetical protein
VTLPDSIRRKVLELAVQADLTEGVALVKSNGHTFRVVLDDQGVLHIDTATLWGVTEPVEARIPAQV